MKPLVAACALLVACGDRPSPDAPATPPTAASPAPEGSGAAASAPASSASGAVAATDAAPSAPTAAPLALIDRNFVSTAALGSRFELQAAELAAEQAGDPAVKAFAAELIEHHGAALDALGRIAAAHGFELPHELPATKRQQLQRLQPLRGARFDRQFVRAGIEQHVADIRSFEKAARDLKDPQLRQWAAATLPALQQHLAHARMLPGGGERASTTGLGSIAAAEAEPAIAAEPATAVTPAAPAVAPLPDGFTVAVPPAAPTGN